MILHIVNLMPTGITYQSTIRLRYLIFITINAE